MVLESRRRRACECVGVRAHALLDAKVDVEERVAEAEGPREPEGLCMMDALEQRPRGGGGEGVVVEAEGARGALHDAVEARGRGGMLLEAEGDQWALLGALERRP